VRYDLHGAVEGKRNCKAYLRGITPCSETSGAYSSALSGKELTFDIRVSLLMMQSVRNRLDGEASKRLTVEVFCVEGVLFWASPQTKKTRVCEKGFETDER
jgi:hypothetical protein